MKLFLKSGLLNIVERSFRLFITGKMAGIIKYDVPTGVPVDGNLEMNMNVSNGGQSTPMNMDINMKISGKKSQQIF